MGIIFDIQRFCIHDGPGIRTTVFLKGCPLRCIWCSNPESQQTGPQFMFSKDRCMGCMECLRACPEHQPPSSASYLEGTCRLCGSCEAVCPRGAISQKGRIVSPAELVEELRRDAAVFSSTSGGVTFSGGEPLMQADFLRQCLVLCKQAGMDTCLETTCYAPWETIYLCIPYVDHFLCDVKNPLSDRHRAFTGVPSEKILATVAQLITEKADVTVRIPVIPGFNTDQESESAFISYFYSCHPKQIELLPYHSYGEKKYELLRRAYPGADIPGEQAQSCAEALQHTLLEQGFSVRISG